jgi:autotransporter-associated beta strand protein
MSITNYPNGSTNANPLVLTDDSTQLQETSGTATQSGVISETGGSHGLEKIGAGTLILSANNSYSGGTTISAGTLSISDDAALGATAGVLTLNGGTLKAINNIILTRGIVLGSSGGTIDNNTYGVGIGGVISGSGTLTVTGPFAVGLTGNNTYSGTTRITGYSALQIGNGGTTGTLGTGAVTMDTGGRLRFNRSDTITVSNAISGTGDLSAAGSGPGAGTVILTGANSYARTYVEYGATLQIGSGGSSGSLGTGVVSDNGTLRFNRSDTITVANLVQDGGLIGALVQAGSGTTILTANNTYTGGTTISAGTLQLGNGGTTGWLGTGAVTNNANLVFNRSDSITVANAISGTGHVTFTNFGGVFLTGNNTYTGGTTIYEGAILVGNGGTTGSITGDVIAGVATSNSGINFDRSDNITFGGNISGLGYLAQYGTGTLTLTGNNTYGAYTTILQGTLAIASASSLGAGDIKMYGGVGGTLQFNAAFALAQNILLGGGNFDTNGNNDTLSGVLSTMQGSNVQAGYGGFAKLGAGTLTLTGANTYLGPTVISTGTLQIGNGGTIGSLGTGAVTDNSMLVFNRSDNITVANDISGSGTLTQAGSGTLTLTGTDTYTGVTTISSGTLALSGSHGIMASSSVADNAVFDISQAASSTLIKSLSGSGTVALGGRQLTITNGTGQVSTGVFSGVIQDGGIGGGTGGSVAISGGSEAFTGSNTYTGTTTIAAGASLYIGLNTATGSLGGGAVTDNGFLAYARTAATTLANVISGSGELDQLGSGTLTITAADSYTGRTLIDTGTTLALSGAGSIAASSYVGDYGGTFDISGTTSGASIKALSDLTSTGADVALGSKTLTISAGANYVFSGAIHDGGIAGGTAGSLVISGGSQDLTGANSYTGTTTIASGASLIIGNNTATGSLGSGAVSNNGLLVYYLTSTATVGNAISGSGGFEQYGSGTTTLSGTDTYTGSTKVTHGTLLVDGAIASSSVTVASGATLGCTGTVGAASIQSGGTLAPGDGIGTLTVNGNLTLASGATDAEQLSPTTADEIIVNGNASIAGNLTENFAGGSYGHQTYTILHATGTLSGTFGNVTATGLPAGLGAFVTYDAHNVYLTTDYAPVVTTTNLTELHGQTLAASSLFSVSDADGDAVTRYQIWDGTDDPSSGHFTVNGVAQAARTVIDISAAQLAQVSFVTGSVGDALQIRAYDGAAWSPDDSTGHWALFTVSVSANHAPVLTTSDVAAQRNQTLAASSLFTVSDAEGDAITRYQLWDGTTDPSSGYFVVNGVAQAPRTVIDITAAQLAQTSFVTGSIGDALQIRAYDGTAWSPDDSTGHWALFNVSVPVNHAPVLTTSDVAAQRNQTLAASSLFSVSDADGDTITRYQLWDGTDDPSSGHFVVNGAAQASRTVIDITAAQLAQTSFVTGSVGDALQIRAYDGTAWSPDDSTGHWALFNVSVPINHAPVVTTSDVAAQRNQTLAASSLFTVSDADGDTITRYQLWDGTDDPSSGHFVVGGVAQAPRTVIDITAAQLAQTSFVTGSVGDALQIRAYDGTAWGPVDSTGHWALFNVSLPPNNPPVVTTADITAQASHSLAASSLFTVSDADGDAITQYQLWDGTDDPSSGNFVVNGVTQSPRTVIDIPSSQLGQVSFLTGSTGDMLQVRASDGKSWSPTDSTGHWSPFHVAVG